MILPARVAAVSLVLMPLVMAPARPAHQYTSFYLPKSWQDMTNDKNPDFRKFVQGLDWTDSEKERLVKRKCKHDTWCKYVDSNDSSNTTIKAVEDVKDFDVAYNDTDPAHANGAVVGRVNVYQLGNRGRHDEDRYDLPGSGEMAYLVAMRSPNHDNVGSWVLILDQGAGSPYKVLGTGRFIKCYDNPGTVRLHSYAGFVAKCGAKHGPIIAAIAKRDSIAAAMHANKASENDLKDAQAAVDSVFRLDDYINPIGPAWFSCVDGCCIADSQ